jgi:rod shape-determining protein MreD
MSRSSGALVFPASLAVALILQIVELPAALTAARPLWVLATLAYWALSMRELPIMLAAFVLGLLSDAQYNSALGQHALGLVTAAFIVRRLRGFLIMFPTWQLSLALAPVWALYAFMMFWVDGLTHHSADNAMRWLPVLSTALVWPLAALLLNRTRAQRIRSNSRLS